MSVLLVRDVVIRYPAVRVTTEQCIEFTSRTIFESKVYCD